jgi:hypothetical protein
MSAHGIKDSSSELLVLLSTACVRADVQSALSGRSEALVRAWWSRTVRLLLSEKSFLLTHCPQIYIRKEISRPGFLTVNR